LAQAILAQGVGAQAVAIDSGSAWATTQFWG